MQVLTIPDLHGKSFWKHAVNDPQFSLAEKVVFIGDYVDSYDLSDEKIYANLIEIIAFRKNHADKVELLLGNHDIHYLFYPNYRCSGFRPAMQHDLSKLFQENISIFKAAFQVNNNLWSHAGVSNGWLESNYQTLVANGLKNYNYGEVFNKILFSEQRDVLHQVSSVRGGMHRFGGITWADLTETISDPLKDFNQFVGHTPVRKPFREEVSELNASITYLDCLQSVKEFNLIKL